MKVVMVRSARFVSVHVTRKETVMQTLTSTTAQFVVHDPITTVELHPRSIELGADVERLRREELEAIDRRRQDDLARFRRIQDQD
jgi:hypothetical protein